MQDLSKTIGDMTTTNQHSTQPEHFLLMSNSPSAVINLTLCKNSRPKAYLLFLNPFMGNSKTRNLNDVYSVTAVHYDVDNFIWSDELSSSRDGSRDQ